MTDVQSVYFVANVCEMLALMAFAAPYFKYILHVPHSGLQDKVCRLEAQLFVR